MQQVRYAVCVAADLRGRSGGPGPCDPGVSGLGVAGLGDGPLPASLPTGLFCRY